MAEENVQAASATEAVKPAENLIHLTIDGKECTCEKGAFLLQVAKDNGIFIPTLCNHPAFEGRGACRVCIVEVEIRGRGKIVTSCVYPVEQDCAVYTNSDTVKEERAMVLALLKARSPESIRISKLAEHYGAPSFDRFVTLDGEKCIVCGLCMQACESLGTGAISLVLRGTDKKVDTPYSNPSLDCIGCLSCANVCPVDAIEFTDDGKTRHIWGCDFELVHCASCGEVMGTPEMLLKASKETGEEVATLCDACKKEKIGEDLKQVYHLI